MSMMMLKMNMKKIDENTYRISGSISIYDLKKY